MGEKKPRRSKKQIIIDSINKSYAGCSSFSKSIKKIESMLDNLQAEYDAELKNNASIKRLTKGKSKEQIQTLIDGLNEEIKKM